MHTRIIALIRKEFIQIWRDPRTLALVLIMPIMQLFLLGYAATNDVRNVPMAVFDQDRSPSSRALLDAYRAADYFHLAFEVDSEKELQDRVDRGDVRVGLIIPPGYEENMMGEQSAQVAFILDGSDPTVGATALSAAQQIGQSYATRVLERDLARTGQPISIEAPIDIRSQVWYNPDLISAYFMIPGVVAMILYMLTSILTANTIVRERERGTIEQLIVTPIRPWELVVGKITPYVILALLNTVEILAIGAWWFDVPVRGSLIQILLLSGLFLLSSLGMGLFASTIANTQQEAMLTVWMSLLPSLFLSGFFFPLEAMPKVLQWISYIFPLRYYLVVIRSLLLKGVDVQVLATEVIALTVFGVVIMAAAAFRFRKRLD